MHGEVRGMHFLCLAEMHPRLVAQGKATREELSFLKCSMVES